MAWSMAGSYVANCNCHGVCPCPVGQKPSSDSGECVGVGVFHIERGACDDIDLSGLNVALYNFWPGVLTEGNWKVGIVVDAGASDEQVDALDRIFRGQEGGPFGELSALYGEYLGTERGAVSYSDGERPSGSVEGRSELSFEPLRGPDGSPTTVKNAAFGFAPEFRIGTGSGSSNGFGLSYDEAHYGEAAAFEFASEQPEGAATGRV
jgi:hypothetical protein